MSVKQELWCRGSLHGVHLGDCLAVGSRAPGHIWCPEPQSKDAATLPETVRNSRNPPLVNGPKMTKIDQNRSKTGFSGQIRDK